MGQLALVFVEIALHRKGPDALPASQFLFGLVLSVYLVVSLITLLISWPLDMALGAMILNVIFYLAFFAIVLLIARRIHRYRQTMMALLGTETLLSCLSLPLLLTRTTGSEGSSAETLATTALLLILLWSIDIAGFVISRALDKPYIVGVSIMVGYVISSMVLGEFLLPSPD